MNPLCRLLFLDSNDVAPPNQPRPERGFLWARCNRLIRIETFISLTVDTEHKSD